MTAFWIGNIAIHFSGIVFYSPDFLQNLKFYVTCSAYYDYYYKVKTSAIEAKTVFLKIFNAYITYTYILVIDDRGFYIIKIVITAYLVFILVGT